MNLSPKTYTGESREEQAVRQLGTAKAYSGIISEAKRKSEAMRRLETTLVKLGLNTEADEEINAIIDKHTNEQIQSTQ